MFNISLRVLKSCSKKLTYSSYSLFHIQMNKIINKFTQKKINEKSDATTNTNTNKYQLKNQQQLILKKQQLNDIEQHQLTPIQKIARSQNIMAKKQLQNNYKLINSSPNDNIIQIQQKFIQIKNSLSDRHFFMPNKKQYLLRIDQAYDQIMKVHPNYNITQMFKPKGKITKNQMITYELMKIKKQQKYQLLQTYEMASLVLIFFIFLYVFLEEYELKDQKRLSIGRQFQLGNYLSNKLKEWKVNKFDELIKFNNGNIQFDPKFKQFLQKIGMNTKITQKQYHQLRAKYQ